MAFARLALRGSCQEVIGLRAEDVFAPNVVERARAADAEVLRTRNPVQTEFEFSLGGAEPLHFMDVRYPLDHEVSAIGVLVFDVTARVRRRNRLQVAEARLNAVLEHGPDGFLEYDVADGRVRYANENALRMLGYSIEELRGMKAAALSPVFQPGGAAVDLAPKRIQEALDGDAPRFRWVFRAADGTEVPTRAWLTRLPHRSRERVGALLVDLREGEAARREIEAAHDALERQKRFLDRTEKVSGVGGWERFVGEDQILLTDEACRIYGLDRPGGLVAFSDIQGFAPPEDRRAFTEDLMATVHTGLPVEREFTLTADGRRTVIRYVGQIERCRDGRLRAYGTIQDVTDVRALEAQLLQAQKLEGLGRLAGGIAHDFNNLLTVIQGGLDFIARGLPEEGDQRQDLEDVFAAVSRARDLTGRMLTFARERPGDVREVFVDEIVRRVGRMLGRSLGEDVRIQVSTDPAAGTVCIDPGLLEQVLVNLAVNARDAMPRGGHLAILHDAIVLDEREARTLETDAGPVVRIRVIDDGEGMSEDVQRRIFEPFFTTKESGRGTGLGLSMVYGVVRQARGAVRVQSAPGAGSTFEILFPPGSGGQDDGLPSIGGGDDETGVILLVEDDHQVRKVVRRVLQRVGYEVLDAADGAVACALLRERGTSLDLLLTDVIMPGMSGVEVAEAARVALPALPVLFMSGYAGSHLEKHGLDSSDVDLLRKPFSPSELVARVRNRIVAG